MSLLQRCTICASLCFVAVATLHAVLPIHAQEVPQFSASNITSNGTIDYVNSLASCTYQLVAQTCRTDGVACDGWNTTAPVAGDIGAQCSASLAALAAVVPPEEELAEDPCGADAVATYNQGFHIGGLFIILGASIVGAGFPVLGKYVPFFRVHPFILVIGKCLGIGIILACALVHMLQPATEELSSECLSKAFTEDYGAYPFLFAMLAIILMHFIDFSLESIINEKLEEAMIAERRADGGRPDDDDMPPLEGPKGELYGKSIDGTTNNARTKSDAKNVELVNIKQSNSDACIDDSHVPADKAGQSMIVVPCEETTSDGVTFHISDPDALNHTNGNGNTKTYTNGHGQHDLESGIISSPHKHDDTHHHAIANHGDHHHHITTTVTRHEGHSHGEKDAPGHGHVHSVLLLKGMKRTVSAYMLEFGVTSHSIFIGLTTGIVDESGLRALLVALAFHQAFEGVALGSRIVDADLGSVLEEIFMVCLFAFSAPLGMAIGIGITTSINPNGATYNYTSGIFDAVCAGILLYIGMVLLLKDFPEDCAKYCHRKPWLKFAMFVALWTGAGVMAYIGKYL